MTRTQTSDSDRFLTGSRASAGENGFPFFSTSRGITIPRWIVESVNGVEMKSLRSVNISAGTKPNANLHCKEKERLQSMGGTKHDGICGIVNSAPDSSNKRHYSKKKEEDMLPRRCKRSKYALCEIQFGLQASDARYSSDGLSAQTREVVVEKKDATRAVAGGQRRPDSPAAVAALHHLDTTDMAEDRAQAPQDPDIEALPPPPAANEISDNIITDPPPPYPSGRPRRTRGSRRHQDNLQPIHTHVSSSGSYSDNEQGTEGHTTSSGPSTEEEDGEGAPFLTTNSGHLRNPAQRRTRPRSASHASTMSAAPSLAHTILSLFEQEDDEDEARGPIHLPEDSLGEGHMQSFTEEHDGMSLDLSRRSELGFWSVAGWKRYFAPMGRAAFYRSLAHLLLINFPYGLAAWVYLFGLTVSGSVLLIALPLGALLCFLDLLGARAFARGELYLQTTFHSPLSYPPPYPPRPIFTRYREATNQEIESGHLASGRTGLVRERSFYKNTYAMFTDPTSYQALFYFIVIKPAITIILLLFTLVFVIPSIILVLPAPAALRAVRKLGRWQANIAVEGLYHAFWSEQAVPTSGGAHPAGIQGERSEEKTPYYGQYVGRKGARTSVRAAISPF
ncbi:hypothetical protein FA13DRAFT_1712104 [Coprinellus micaceus]|uniref:Uncharacterized protein n=1 Tax=Coprinellus micaceus TaxID=71717 RepID=A0A4Y7T380_COPMI|nr:hypothetical protein FA13DRAFT_1712104 [Coprinellus micaceus]